MDHSSIAQIAFELSDLLQLQLDSMMGRGLTGFTPHELDAYQRRNSRIADLRAELHRFANPK
jgi:hypothetical protein